MQQSAQDCGDNFGYKSCKLKPDQTCITDQCYLWAVEVMAVCPQFFPDLSEPLACCLSPPRSLAPIPTPRSVAQVSGIDGLIMP